MNAILAAILSFIVAGLGQALSGDLKRGIIFFVAQCFIAMFVSFIFKQNIMYLINTAFALYAAYDAYKMNQ